MKKTYVVIGLGKFGTAVARRLFELGNEVLAIDDSAEKVQHIEHNVTYAVVADARDENALRSLGVKNYDCAIVAIGTDLAASVITTLNLKGLGVPYVICKATDDTQKQALEKIGADRVLIPEREIGIKLDGDYLTISAEHKEENEEKKDNFIRRERRIGSYSRSFDITGIDAEKITAEYNNGVLDVTLPKVSADKKEPKQIEIR